MCFRTCRVCETDFETKSSRLKTCYECHSQNRKVILQKPVVLKKCIHCNNEFSTIYKCQKYCSDACGHLFRIQNTPKKHSKICEWCKKEFRVETGRKDIARFCSRDCHYEFARSDDPIVKEMQRNAAKIGMIKHNKENGGPWNLGLTKETDERLLNLANNRMGENNPMCKAIADGRSVVWCKGFTKETHPTLMKISLKNKENIINQYQNGFTRKVNTEPERQFKEIIEKYNVEYQQSYFLKNKIFDFYLPEINTLVEIDGIYWHGKNLEDEQLNETQTKNRKNDKLKDGIAIENGYNLVRFWEGEINEDLVFTKLNII